MNIALEDAMAGRRLANDRIDLLLGVPDLQLLMQTAAMLRDRGHGNVVSYSRKVFIPLTQLCRDVCHYCTFAQSPNRLTKMYLSADDALDIARRGAAVGCKEALFTLGDKPELRWLEAASELSAMGFQSTLAYLADVADRVRRETGLLPHLNPGVMTREDIAALRRCSYSMGLMLETSAERLGEKGGPHFGSPDKRPADRLACIRDAGELSIPFTSGLLIGIGETRRERLEALVALRALHEQYGHLQEIIIQNFVPKARTRMQKAPPPILADLLWTIAVARILFGPAMNIQAPPNLSPKDLPALIGAGINDWGGVSPVTVDHVNPEAPWPKIESLAVATRMAGKALVERLTIYPTYARASERWVDDGLRAELLKSQDAVGFAREDHWLAGLGQQVARHEFRHGGKASATITAILSEAQNGILLTEEKIEVLFAARGDDVQVICAVADALRREVNGANVGYVVNRNINYTNVCSYACAFCAFSKGKNHAALRGRPYDLDMEELARRVQEAWARGATEVCLQGGIHPDYTGATYLNIVEVAKSTAPDIHIHAFSPLEVWYGAQSAGLSLRDYLETLKRAGLGSLPGTAAEILDDEVRAILCPDKVTTAQWFEVMEAAHSVGLRSTATIMFGHVDGPRNWARHLLRIRAHQELTGGFTEFVPLPFVAQEAPIFLKGKARRGPTWREAMLMHAVARIALHPVIPHIQASWVKLGPEGAQQCLSCGADDLGGTLMNESISRAAGAAHGQELAPAKIVALVAALGRTPQQRTTLYGTPPASRIAASFAAPELHAIVNAPLRTARSARLQTKTNRWVKTIGSRT
jgi:FO synthase